MPISPEETEIVGSWAVKGGRVFEDEVSRRVRSLVNTELRYVSATADGWLILYFSPEDGRYWELSYPEGEVQGGGPPTLRAVADEYVRERYRLNDSALL